MIQKFASRFFSTISKFKRDSRYNYLTKDDFTAFQDMLPSELILTENLKGYNTCWMNKYKGNSQLVLTPKTTEQVSKILKYCNERMLAVVPQSGNTCLVGGSVPVHDEIIINMQFMNKIIKYNEQQQILTTESGLILEKANEFLAKYNTLIPWDMGAKGSCTLGGNVAANAGGIHFIQFGPMRGNILGMEVVLGNGDILDQQSEIRKDNTGLDLKQIFIGSEGILGIITKLNILCYRKDKAKTVVMVKVKKFEDVLAVYKLAKQTLNTGLTGLEYLDHFGFQMVMNKIHKVKNPFNSPNEDCFYTVVEISSNLESSIKELENTFFEHIINISGVIDCVKAENENQYHNIWNIRENVGPACGETGKLVLKYDISLDVAKMNDMVLKIRERTKGLNCIIVGYGHIGDGNMHINVTCMDANTIPKIEALIEPYIFEYLSKIKGSISAEHGIGLMKSNYLHYQKQPNAIEYMHSIKKIFDPNNILNPYKVIPHKYEEQKKSNE